MTAARRHGVRAVCAVFACSALAPSGLAAQCPDGSPPPCNRPAATASTANANSVAVLLFNNVARDSAYAYLGDGLASEIATSLASVPRLSVSSPGLVRRVQRDAEGDPRVIGRRLGVRYVVEGDYQRGGDRIRVSVRLVTVASGVQRWGTTYTRPSNDLLAVQEDVAREVATSLAGELLPQERAALTVHGTRNPQAWDHFLRGNFALARRTREGITRAMEEYGEAVRLDPAFAGAEARIALCHALIVDWGWRVGVPREELLRRGFAAAERALARDSGSADAWMARGYLRSEQVPSPDYAEVFADFDRAVRLEPGNAEALHQFASKHLEVGDWQGAFDLETRAIAADPDRPVSVWQNAWTLQQLGRDDEARVLYDSALALNPAFPPAAFQLAQFWLVHGDTAKMCRYAMRTNAEAPEWSLPAIAICHAVRGDTAGARATLAPLLAAADSLAEVPTFTATNIAYALLHTGRRAEALAMIERGGPRNALYWSQLVATALAPLRSEPRFAAFVRFIRPRSAQCCSF